MTIPSQNMLEFNLASEKVILFSARAHQVKTLVDDFILELKKVRVLLQMPFPEGPGGREQGSSASWTCLLPGLGGMGVSVCVWVCVRARVHRHLASFGPLHRPCLGHLFPLLPAPSKPFLMPSSQVSPQPHPEPQGKYPPQPPQPPFLPTRQPQAQQLASVGQLWGGGMGKACTRPDGHPVSLRLSAPALHICRNPFDSHSILHSCTHGMFRMLPRNQGGIPVGERSQGMAPGFRGGGGGTTAPFPGPPPRARTMWSR